MSNNDKPLIETHGKVDNTQPTTLEQIWGFNELAKYGTTDEAVYAEQLQNMNRTDLEAHARRVGEVIVEDSSRLRERLVRSFRAYVASLRRPVLPKQEINLTPEVKKILAEGR